MIKKRRTAFTIVELLVVMGVIGLLLGLILPAVQATRGVADRTRCLNNLRQVGVALHHYHDSHGRLPPLPAKVGTHDPNGCLSWMGLILPQMDEEPLYRAAVGACQIDRNPIHNPPHTGHAAVVRAYTCPADGRLSEPHPDSEGLVSGYTSYIGIGYVLHPGKSTSVRGTLGYSPSCRFSDITDGTSNTIMVGERPPPANFQAGWWYPVHSGTPLGARGPHTMIVLGAGPMFLNDVCVGGKGTLGPGRLENPCDRFHLWSLHRGGANFLFADGAARYLPYSAEPMMFSLGTRSGGETVDIP